MCLGLASAMENCSAACDKVQLKYHSAENSTYLSGRAIELLPRFREGENVVEEWGGWVKRRLFEEEWKGEGAIFSTWQRSLPSPWTGRSPA